MNLIDTNCVTHIFERQLNFSDTYYLAPEVAEEVETYQAQYHRQLSERIIAIFSHHLFDECLYIGHYKRMLNKHEGKSFFNMTGFGDISILATIHTVLEMGLTKSQKELFGLSEIFVFTEDDRLSKRLLREFYNQPVSHKLYKDII